MSAVVNNDNLSALIAALLCWQFVALLKGGNVPSNARALGLGMLLGRVSCPRRACWCSARRWGCVCRSGAPARLADARLAPRQHPHLWLATLASGWYFVRNVPVFGDPLAWSLVLGANAVRTEALDAGAWLAALAQVFRSYWLDWNGIALPAPSWHCWRYSWRSPWRVECWRWRARDEALAVEHMASRACRHPVADRASAARRRVVDALDADSARHGAGAAYPALATINLCLVLGLHTVHRALPAVFTLALLVLALAAPVVLSRPSCARATHCNLAVRGAADQCDLQDKLRLIG
jgi:hypothetical protein